jgi:HD-like signal output (HDOD) protein
MGTGRIAAKTRLGVTTLAYPSDKPPVVPLTEKQDVSSVPASAALREKALGALRGLPPFSPILNRLVASLAGEDASFSKLADLIEKDTVVTGNILHLVNSALYARRGTVNSVRHALSLLGVNKLRNAVLGMSITRMWRQARPANSWSMERFNLHSAATAILSDMLAQKLPVNYPEGAFVAGLMHDLGRLLIAVGLPEEHDRILDHHRGSDRPVTDSELTVLGFTHPEISAQALAVWKLPEPIQQAVRDHHAPPDENQSCELPLARVIGAADQYVHSTGVSILPHSGKGGRADLAALEQLGLDTIRLETLLGEFQTEFDAMTPFFR